MCIWGFVSGGCHSSSSPNQVSPPHHPPPPLQAPLRTHRLPPSLVPPPYPCLIIQFPLFLAHPDGKGTLQELHRLLSPSDRGKSTWPSPSTHLLLLRREDNWKWRSLSLSFFFRPKGSWPRQHRWLLNYYCTTIYFPRNKMWGFGIGSRRPFMRAGQWGKKKRRICGRNSDAKLSPFSTFISRRARKGRGRDHE